MNNKTLIYLSFCLSLIIFGCSKDSPVSRKVTQSEQDNLKAGKSIWISGVSFYAETTECDYAGEGATYALKMTGDLEGCHYVWVEKYKCSGDGNYFETGTELFVGTYKGQPGTFRTTYKFAAKFPGCTEDGGPMGVEIFGLCNHPIIEGSGEGVFEGATGVLHFWDNIPAGKFPYRGRLNF